MSRVKARSIRGVFHGFVFLVLFCAGLAYAPFGVLAEPATGPLDSSFVEPASGTLITDKIGTASDRLPGRLPGRLSEPDLATAPMPEPSHVADADDRQADLPETDLATAPMPEPGQDVDQDGHWAGDGHNHDSQLSGSLVRVNRVAELKDQVVAGINTTSGDLKALLLPGTIVHFWASWCAPCEEEFPRLQRFYHTRISQDLAAMGVQLITISNDFAVAPAVRFIEKHGTTFPVYLDTEQTSNLAMVGQRALPSTVMVDAEGRFHRLALGKLDWDFPRLPDILAATAARLPGVRSNAKQSVKEDK